MHETYYVTVIFDVTLDCIWNVGFEISFNGMLSFDFREKKKLRWCFFFGGMNIFSPYIFFTESIFKIIFHN